MASADSLKGLVKSVRTSALAEKREKSSDCKYVWAPRQELLQFTRRAEIFIYSGYSLNTFKSASQGLLTYLHLHLLPR